MKLWWIGWVFLSTAAANSPQERDPLVPLLFLEGTWHGEGKGPYGPYDFETRVERRGRWLLLTSNVFSPGSDELWFVSTPVYGRDDEGLILALFDTVGSFRFRGEATADGARFEWKEGDRYKRLSLRRLPDGAFDSVSEALEPALFDHPVTFEGKWIPGKRR